MTAAVGTVLVAGVGNIFRTDDGFGVEVGRALATRGLPDGAELVDVGIRGMHLAYQLEHDLSALGEQSADEVPVPDAHDMSPDTVLTLLASLAVASGLEPTAGLRRVLVVGCEPASVADGMGLTEPVAASVDRAATAVLKVLDELLAGR
jgi:hydrogenase maturation protease